jgi:hypothetical protein
MCVREFVGKKEREGVPMRMGAVAAAGHAANMGVKKTASRKSTPHTTALRPVRAPTCGEQVQRYGYICSDGWIDG